MPGMFFRTRVMSWALVVLAGAAGVAAQGGAPLTGQAATLQQFADYLKLDDKAQVPTVEGFLNEAAKAAVPLAQEMARARRQWLDADLAGQGEGQTAARAATVAAAFKMASLETHTYRRVFAILKPNQQAKTPKAFPLMAGLFQPPPTPPRSMRPPGRGGVLFDAAPVLGQRGGGGRGGGGGLAAPPKTRLQLLTDLFTLDKTQVSAAKAVLDAAAKTASTREALTASYAAIGAAVLAGATQEEIDAAVQRYAMASADMTSREIAALADVLRSLSDVQRGNTNAVGTAVAMMRGAFVDNKWNMAPGSKTY